MRVQQSTAHSVHSTEITQIPLPSRVSAVLAACAHVCAAVISLQLGWVGSAAAVLNSPNSQIPRTVDAALRRSIPAFNAEVRRVQDDLEVR